MTKKIFAHIIRGVIASTPVIAILLLPLGCGLGAGFDTAIMCASFAPEFLLGAFIFFGIIASAGEGAMEVLND